MFRCFGSVQGKIILAVVAIAAIYLMVWHSVHLAAIAPVLLLLACPLMHVVMHGGHDRHPHHPQDTNDKES